MLKEDGDIEDFTFVIHKEKEAKLLKIESFPGTKGVIEFNANG